MEKDMDPIFITYANASIKHDPGLFWQMYKRFAPKHRIEMYGESERKAVHALVSAFRIFVRCQTSTAAQKKFRKIMDNFDMSQTYLGRCTSEHMLKWGMEACFSDCNECDEHETYYEIVPLESKGRCYECLQSIFRESLTKFIETGKLTGEGENRSGDSHLYFLEQLIAFGTSNHYKPCNFVVSPKRVERGNMLDWDLFMRSRERTPFHDLFFYTIVGNDFVTFLTTTDWRKLKKCEECGRFYISRTIRPSRFCSSSCNVHAQNRRRIETGKARDYKRKRRAEGKDQ